MAAVLFPYLAVAIWASSRYDVFRLGAGPGGAASIAGGVLVAVWLGFYPATARKLLGGVRRTELMTSGAYALSRNPLYASFILFLIPGVGLLLHSWLVMTGALVTYAVFKLMIAREYRELEAVFGQAYRDYHARTSELLPWPPQRGSV